MGVMTEDVRKDVPGSIMFVDDFLLCGNDETDMRDDFETWTRALRDRWMSSLKIRCVFFKFGPQMMDRPGQRRRRSTLL